MSESDVRVMLESGSHYRLADWSVFPDRNEIARGGETLRVERMSMRLLTLLLENGLRTTTRDEIVERLWDGRIVSDDAITKQISKLRACLGDDPREPRILQTVRKVGVRLLVVPEPLTASAAGKAEAGGRKWWLAAGLLILVAAVALLAWTRWSREPAQALQLTERPLTSAPGLEFDPAISPDGRWLAYVERAPSSAEAALFVRALDDDRARRITEAGTSASTPAWSRGGRIAFVSQDARACTVMAGSPFGTVRPVAACAATLGLAWLGEDRLILSAQPRFGASFQLFIIDLATGRSTPLTIPPLGTIGDRLPTVSPDGGHVYFLRTQTVGIEHVLEVDSASGRTRPIVEESAHIVGLAAAGNGALLIASDRGRGLTGLWQLDLADRGWRQLMPGISGALSVSADGRRIVLARAQTRLALWRQPLAGGAAARVTETTQADRLPALAGDGTLAFVSNRSGAQELWRLARDGDAPEQLSRLGGRDVQDPSWSPDGRMLAAAVAENNNFDLFLIDARSGAARRVAATPADERHPAFAADGNHLFFARSNGARFDLVRLDLRSGGEERIVADALRALPSGDGLSLYFGRLLRPGLFRLSLADGRVTQVAGWPEWNDMRNWTIAQNRIWGVARSEGRAVLMRFDPRDGTQHEVAPLADIAFGSGLAIRESDAIYTRRVESESDIVLLELVAS